MLLDRTRAATAKAKEHLDVAAVLADRGYFAQAYAHASLAIEEVAVSGIRLVTDSGIVPWEFLTAQWGLQESDLSRGGGHQTKLGIGLTFALALPALVDAVSILPQDEVAETALQRAGPVVAGVIPKALAAIRDPTLLRMLQSGYRRREAAFYSTPKKAGDPNPIPPSEEEYTRLVAFARAVVPPMDRDWPPDDEVSKLAPILKGLAPNVLTAARAAKEKWVDDQDRAQGPKPPEPSRLHETEGP